MSRKFKIGELVSVIQTLSDNPPYNVFDEGTVVDYYPTIKANGGVDIKPYAVQMRYGNEFILEEDELEKSEIVNRLNNYEKARNT